MFWVIIVFGLGTCVSEDVQLAYLAGCLKVEVPYFFKTLSLTHCLVMLQRDTFFCLWMINEVMKWRVAEFGLESKRLDHGMPYHILQKLNSF
jgi:hypothetical protein